MKLDTNSISNIEKWYELSKLAKSVPSRDVINTYNTVFEGERKKQPYTSCGACLRKLIHQMYTQMQKEMEDVNKAVEEVEQLVMLEQAIDEASEPTEEPKQTAKSTPRQKRHITRKTKK